MLFFYLLSTTLFSNKKMLTKMKGLQLESEVAPLKPSFPKLWWQTSPKRFYKPTKPLLVVSVAFIYNLYFAKKKKKCCCLTKPTFFLVFSFFWHFVFYVCHLILNELTNMEIGLDNLQLFASMCRACNFFCTMKVTLMVMWRVVCSWHK